MALRPKTIAWWDLETTGNYDNSRILEVGIVLTDTRLNILDEKQIVLGSQTVDLLLTDVDPIVLKMHADNGLWKDLDEGDRISLVHADESIRSWLFKINYEAGGGTNHIAFAGSGVGHFDRKYIDRDLPKSSRLMTYWPLDIGVIRRMTQLADIDEDPHIFTDLKPHRALDDARLALYEARAWVNRQRSLRNHEEWEFSDGKS